MSGSLTSRAELEAVLEAILFVTPEPVAREQLLEVFDEEERAAAAEALAAVLARYQAGDGRGVMAEEVAGGVRLVTRPELHGYLRRFFEITGSARLSMAALETLAIVAYRQPITAPEIQELRGVNAAGVLKTLLERRLVRIAGRKEVVGRPFLYRTTRQFLMHFGLRTLKELPPLEEFEEAFGGEAEPAGRAAPPPVSEDREEEMLREAAALEEGDAMAAEEDEPAADAGIGFGPAAEAEPE